MAAMRYVLLLAGVVLALVSVAAHADALIERFKRSGWDGTDFTQVSIPLGEIMSGGPPKDGIPSIDKPEFKPIGEISDIVDREPVVGLDINGDARAYPLRVLTWHEIVNDDDQWSPRYQSHSVRCAMLPSYSSARSATNGEVLDFGTTGMLRKSRPDHVRPADTKLVAAVHRRVDRRRNARFRAGTGPGAARILWRCSKSVMPDGKVLVPNNPAHATVRPQSLFRL